MENKDYLQKQIITYIGNKRQLLFLIKEGIDLVKIELQQEKISFLDLFFLVQESSLVSLNNTQVN